MCNCTHGVEAHCYLVSLEPSPAMKEQLTGFSIRAASVELLIAVLHGDFHMHVCPQKHAFEEALGRPQPGTDSSSRVMSHS